MVLEIEKGKYRNRVLWLLNLGRGGWPFPLDPKKYFKEIEKGIRAKPFWWSAPTKYGGKKGQIAPDADKYWKKRAKEL